jgi:OmpA-OmpF porin, OOP family
MTRRCQALITRLIISTAICVALTSLTAAADVPGSKDHPLLKRYEGSTIIKYVSHEFDQYVLPLGPATGNFTESNLTKSIKLEGKLTRLTYLIPVGRSAIEVLRNYESDLRNSGYTILFQGVGAELGHKPMKSQFAKAAGYGNIKVAPNNWTIVNVVDYQEQDDAFVAVKLDRPEGIVHVAAYGVTLSSIGAANMAQPGQVLLQVDIVEAKPMETKMVTVSASEMESSIQMQGSVALYGIFFDFNSAELKSESMATLQEIATLLKNQPALKLLVVGHTDNVASFDYNLDLSKRRAASVVQALATQHGINQKRLNAFGVSFASPITSNKTEEGRAKNRRVELVEY